MTACRIKVGKRQKKKKKGQDYDVVILLAGLEKVVLLNKRGGCGGTPEEK